MFGIFKRVAELEEVVAKLICDVECAKGNHKWTWTSGPVGGYGAPIEHIEGLKCDHCYKLKQYTEVKED